MGGSLDTLPFDIVLRIFYFLSAHDVVRTCQTCKRLGATLGEHCVWLALAAKCCSKNASAARHISSLAALSTCELRAFAVEQARLDRYWVTGTTFTKPLPHFRSQAPTPLLFCELLPGGKYLILVRRTGDVHLLSLMDLGDIHEVSKRSVARSGHTHIASLTTDNRGRPLLVLSLYGSPRRIFFIALDLGKRSISPIRCLDTEMSVLAIAAQHDVVACLCRHIEHGTSSFLVTAVDEAVERTLHISQIPIDITTTYLCDICLPTPTTLLLFEASNIRCYHLPDTSRLAPGDHHLHGLSPIWSWEGPTLPKARLTATPVHWEPGHTAPTVITFLCDFLSHVVTLCPSGKSSGSSHLDIIEHTYTNVCRPVATPYQGTTLLKSQKGMWFRLENGDMRSHDFMTFSTDDARRTRLVRLDTSKAGIQEHMVPVVNFDEVSGRIVILARTHDGNFHVDYGFVVDMP